METIELKTELETKQLAGKLALLLHPNDVVTLTGDLGAGKTTFTKGIGEALGVKRTINSPTFTIVKSYQGLLPLHHIDAYRLENSEEDIGFDEYFHDGGITVVEWPQFIEPFLPEERLDLVIEKLSGEERLVTLKPKGPSFEKVCEELMK
ncbi:tRNA (adenosine(37)-N6)-threonylcarbamoyltransferase complex ATPase subunit type 1 TsaE [Amphibacillus sp. MSJ-3]|uniref:tRNA (adenosine(37)-N6)-threonylcarbamoyltransferase complex ATPase subunit type 1 TsaE n=1 Tax=Amphibacillus sp. MSJ-3 TaxID=2841505 RepID=UPI001C0EA2EB|nr:tRNA (adenosine(37)-N6)-threonylcarbamoyltransferase complex ATPase subunit type 1 TsaE [Amphibacillus sp. MSJ-3]MBU5595351.1 tRNA (adenosine(37)-N6)-threonylcarbamoyltransferase complex ATPase subunit type 1 TsaE [Amphibacillus sp. MSJ-3]